VWTKATAQVRKPGGLGKVASMLFFVFLFDHSNGLSSTLYQFSKLNKNFPLPGHALSIVKAMKIIRS